MQKSALHFIWFYGDVESNYGMWNPTEPLPSTCSVDRGLACNGWRLLCTYTYCVGGQFDCFSGFDEFYNCIDLHNNKVAHRTLGRIEVLP